MDLTDAPPSYCLSAVAALLRGLRLPGGVRLLNGLGRLRGRALFRARLHPYHFEFETHDIDQAAMALGRYQPVAQTLLARILRVGDAYVDVGAQLGYTATLAARSLGPHGRMILFEPDPRAFTRLERHLASGRPAAAPRATALRLACSDHAGCETMRLSRVLGRSSLTMDLGEELAGEAEVKVVRLEAKLRALGMEWVRLMKMSVEGHELAALRGAAGLLREGRIDYLLIEKSLATYWAEALEPHHLHGLMTSFGYAGAHEDGRPITRESLPQAEWETLLYARRPALLLDVFPRLDVARLNEGYAPGELEAYAAEVIVANHPLAQARKIIRQAASGRLAEASRAAEELLEAHPELTDLRGHYAYWIWMQGRIAEAIEELRRVEAEQPDNAHVREMIVKFSGG